jgi:hypothetical protein
MADLVSVADGNLTAAATWGTIEATSRLISTSTGATALTTGNLDSAAFVPAATALQGVCVRVANRASGSPTNTLTVHLRNSTTATNVKSVTVNVSDLPVSSTGTDSEGGWLYLKFASTQTPNGTDSYVIRATLSATTTAVSLATNGTANNWQRMLVTTTTAAPAAGDDLHIVGVFDGASSPATTATRTVTMDSTSATDYGSASTNQYTAALDISTRGTLTYGTTASTNYVLRLSGHLSVYRNGTLAIGTAATPIPRSATAVLEFDCAADNDFGLLVKSGGIVTAEGQSRTSGKNVVWTLLTADQSAGATSATVQDDTGWLSGDEIGIASTTRTPGQREKVTLTGDAGASSLAHGATTHAHGGSASSLVQAEVVLLTRNVQIRSVTSTTQAWIELHGAASVDCAWTWFKALGGATPGSALQVELTTGALALESCSGSDSDVRCVRATNVLTSGTIALTSCVFYNHAAGGGTGLPAVEFAAAPSTSGTIAVSDLVILGGSTGSSNNGLDVVGGSAVAIGAVRVSSCYYGVILNGATVVNYNLQTYGPFVIHASQATGLYLADGTATRNLRIAGVTSWRNNTNGVLFGNSMQGLVFTGDVQCFGNVTGGINWINGAASGDPIVILGTLRCAGDSTFGQPYGIVLSIQSLLRASVTELGVATGIYVAHSTADIDFTQGYLYALDLGAATLASGTEIDATVPGMGTTTSAWSSYLAMMRKDGSAGVHHYLTPLGALARETSTVDVSPALKLTPAVATTYPMRLESGAFRPGRGYLVGVASGATASVSVKVQTDGSYAGDAPRLVLKANHAAGITADVVLDTHASSSGVWETLAGVTPAVTDDCVLEVVVDCNGVAGNVFVDTWTGGGDGSVQYWHGGLPSSAGASGGGGGGGSSVERFVFGLVS